MLAKIKLKAGRTVGSQAQEIAISPINIFVGPNNSGKSKALSEIQGWCANGSATEKLIANVEYEELSDEDIKKLLQEIVLSDDARAGMTISLSGYTIATNRQQLVHLLKNPNADKISYCQEFLRYRLMSLNGQNRTGLVDEQQAGDRHERPNSSFQRLLSSHEKRQKIRRITQEAFGSYFVLDPTKLGTLRIRLSDQSPADEFVEESLNDEAVKFQAASELISDASDGIKAFTGIITELIAGEPRIILIDEPEAFLHPALAQKLGLEIAKISAENKKQVFISTHSSSFLTGCIAPGTPINIIRLTYRDRAATARLLESKDILQLMRTPLLRSSGVLSALFYESVIVTESDNDRAFYQEINERLLRFKPEWGIPNCLFLNAQNKQTIPTIIQPLRQLGIAAAGIVDIDVVKDGGKTWTRLLTSINVPQLLHNPLQNTRDIINKSLVETGRDMKRHGGINILDAEKKEAASDLLNTLSEYGMFAVPGGELESFLKEANVPGEKTQWLIKMFEAMGDNPESENYMYPKDSDVWEFIGDIKKWLIKPDRKGIPS
jgi:ABC-type cobalamin/Fe3+-siderophores transport system ATPase subunit